MAVAELPDDVDALKAMVVAMAEQRALLEARTRHLQAANKTADERIATQDDLAVISDEGAVYLNDHAWIMVLYAMVEYREWAARLTHPLLMPLARQAFAALSKNRHFLSSFLSTETIAAELRRVEIEPCALPAGNVPASNVREFLE